MPLDRGCSLKAYRDNIAKMIEEGTPRDQAVAIAERTLDVECRRKGKPIPSLASAEKKETMTPPGMWGIYGVDKD